MPDHTRDSHSATKRERDVDTAKLKAGGALTGGRLGPLQGGPRAKAKCGAGRAKRGGGGMLLGEEVSAGSAALGAAVVDAGLDEHVARKAPKVRQTRRRARPPFTRARRAVVRVREVRLEVVKAHRARHGCGGRSASHAGKFGGEDS